MELSPTIAIRSAVYDPAAIFASRASYLDTIRLLTDIAVPDLAYGCVIDMIEDGVLMRRGVSVASALPLPNFPTAPHFDAPEGVAAVARTGRARFYGYGWLAALARDDTTIAAIGQSAVRSFSIMPLVFGGQLIGIASFACEHESTGSADSKLATFVRDAAVAIETSRLRESVSDAQRRAEDTRLRIAMFARAGRSFVGSVDLSATLKHFFGHLIDSFADGGGALLDATPARQIHAFGTLDEESLAGLATQAMRLRHSVFTNKGSVIVAPILSEGRVLGALALSRDASRPAFTIDDLTLVEEFAVRTAAFIAIATTVARERHVSRTLQAALRPQKLPVVDGLAIASAYRPSDLDIDVGGDWYDVITIDERRVAFVIGDVMGHGIEAAATMAQLRSGITANLYAGLGPSDCLASADRVLAELSGTPTFASAVVAIFDRPSRSLTLANAGHPAPIVKRDRTLDEGRPPSIMLGIDRSPAREETTTRLERGDLVAFYTDGVFEDRSRPYLEGLRSLHEALLSAGAIHDAETKLLALTPSSSDDRTLLLVEIE